MNTYRMTVYDSFFGKYFICEIPASSRSEAEVHAREIYAEELDTRPSEILITDKLLITDETRPVYRHNSQDYSVKIVSINDGFIFFIVEGSKNPLYKPGEKLKARERDFTLNYTASPVEPRRYAPDPEEKYYRDHATWLERFADSDNDGQED